MLLGHSELRVTADLYSHLQKQTAAKAARHMDAVLNTVDHPTPGIRSRQIVQCSLHGSGCGPQKSKAGRLGSVCCARGRYSLRMPSRYTMLPSP